MLPTFFAHFGVPFPPIHDWTLSLGKWNFGLRSFVPEATEIHFFGWVTSVPFSASVSAGLAFGIALAFVVLVVLTNKFAVKPA